MKLFGNILSSKNKYSDIRPSRKALFLEKYLKNQHIHNSHKSSSKESKKSQHPEFTAIFSQNNQRDKSLDTFSKDQALLQARESSKSRIYSNKPCQFIEQIQSFADQGRSFTLDAKSGKQTSYKEALEKAKKIIGKLNQLGKSKGHQVGLIGGGTLYNEVILTCIKHGIIAVPFPSTLSRAELVKRTEITQVDTIVVCDDHLEEKLNNLKLNLKIVTQQEIADFQLTNAAEETLLSKSDLACFLGTSGTSDGQLKYAVQDRSWLDAQANYIGKWMTRSFSEQYSEDYQLRIFNPSDRGWGWPLWTLVGGMGLGAETLVAPPKYGKFDANEMMDFLQVYNPDIWAFSPAVLQNVMAHASWPFALNDLIEKRVKLDQPAPLMITVGEKLPDSVRKNLQKLGFTVIEGYGQAEMPAGFIYHEGQTEYLMPEKSFVLLDKNNRVTENAGELSMLLSNHDLKGVYTGYLTDSGFQPMTTVETSEGTQAWRMGDEFKKINPNYLKYTGRSFQKIKFKDRTLSPVQIQDAYLAFEPISKAIAVQIKVDHQGIITEGLKVYLLLKDDVRPSKALQDRIRDFLRKTNNHYYLPDHIQFVPKDFWQEHFTTHSQKDMWLRFQRFSDEEQEIKQFFDLLPKIFNEVISVDHDEGENHATILLNRNDKTMSPELEKTINGLSSTFPLKGGMLNVQVKGKSLIKKLAQFIPHMTMLLQKKHGEVLKIDAEDEANIIVSINSETPKDLRPQIQHTVSELLAQSLPDNSSIKFDYKDKDEIESGDTQTFTHTTGPHT